MRPNPPYHTHRGIKGEVAVVGEGGVDDFALIFEMGGNDLTIAIGEAEDLIAGGKAEVPLRWRGWLGHWGRRGLLLRLGGLAHTAYLDQHRGGVGEDFDGWWRYGWWWHGCRRGHRWRRLMGA